MEIMPWKPFREMEPFHREMESLINRVLGEALPARFGEEGWLPRMDIAETKDSLVIEAELPGMDSKDIEVNLSGDMLTIKGEKKTEREENGKHYHCIERHSGSFKRAFRVPANVQSNKVDASFDKGILTITLPKTEEAKEKEIKIKVH
ncbi:HSP20 family protein [Malonomonas rubra DSM 5091]|uniref:HSP20 family protein n=1 Tax=Malonomonas rubra DSM 5091 TaxID=1122189 RepID=A0A1M6NFA7_MALRU|nr:Hsp20/alpha crystallin family protein [Malonomonas rubra]SHJ94382.1 HSP20 family protein [Malonomonas rubra DSM 5091]